MNFLALFRQRKWLAVVAGISLSATATASATPLQNPQLVRGNGRADVVNVDYRGGWRRHDGDYRRHWRGRWRPYRGGRYIHGHGDHGLAAAYGLLAFTAITVTLLDAISESQRRAYASASVRATNAPLGETVYWNRDGAHGAITAVRDGTSSAGRYCREFQQTLTVGGRTERAYGTACRQPDGSWEILP